MTRVKRGSGSDPSKMIARALERFALPDVRARLEAIPFPSPIRPTRTLAEYVDARLAPNAQTPLRARGAVVYEVLRLLDGETDGDRIDRERGEEAALELPPGTRVRSRITGEQGAIAGPGPTSASLLVDWDDGRSGAAPALSLIPL